MYNRFNKNPPIFGGFFYDQIMQIKLPPQGK